jgi:hypothetical protein
LVFDTWLIGNARGELGVDRSRLPRSASLLAGILQTAIRDVGAGGSIDRLAPGAQRCEAGCLSHRMYRRAAVSRDRGKPRHVFRVEKSVVILIPFSLVCDPARSPGIAGVRQMLVSAAWDGRVEMFRFVPVSGTRENRCAAGTSHVCSACSSLEEEIEKRRDEPLVEWRRGSFRPASRNVARKAEQAEQVAPQ